MSAGEQRHPESDGEFFLKNEDYLENGIPLSHDNENDLFYQLAESSQFSTYSKL